MRPRILTLVPVAVAIVVVSGAPVGLAGQAGAPAKKPSAGSVPRRPTATRTFRAPTISPR